MPPRKARKDKPVSIGELRFSGDPQFIFIKLKQEIAERDRYIDRLEAEMSLHDREAGQVATALEEAEGLAARYDAFVQDALNDPVKRAQRSRELGRYVVLFREAAGALKRMRE
jgi:hypothetical protein